MPNMNDIRDQFERFAPVERRIRWYRTINGRTREIGRLFWWQERLWESFVAEFPKYSAMEFQTVCDVFQFCYVHDDRLKPQTPYEVGITTGNGAENRCPFPAGNRLVCQKCSNESRYINSRDATIARIFAESADQFLVAEASNILSEISERSLCGRLAFILDAQLRGANISGYYVDLEYNRKQDGRIKTILNESLEVVTITCDLIVHSRGQSLLHDNLIAIEMKKANRPRLEKEKDRRRLVALTKTSFDGVWSADGRTHPEHVCGYKLGMYMELDSVARRCHFEAYEEGVRKRAWSQAF